MKRFPKKRTLITGAGSGLGRALALEFARMGWNIGVADINAERARETVGMVNASGGVGLEIICDVTKPAELEKTAGLISKHWGGLDILINNAGVAAAGFMEKIPLEQWEWILAINLKSVIHGCRTFIPMMEKQGGGHIVNVASSAGIASLPEMSSYNVTKAAVISLSETLRIELAAKNIGVTVVAPTFFKTNLMDQFNSPDERQHRMAEKFFEKARVGSEQVARNAVRAIQKNRLYAIAQADGRFIWRVKRFSPELYFRIGGFIYRKGIYEKFMNG